jgi:hypothetical protein
MQAHWGAKLIILFGRCPRVSSVQHHRRKEGSLASVGLVWAMLWFYMFFIWIWLLISVFGDIFRSDDLGGWSKLAPNWRG